MFRKIAKLRPLETWRIAPGTRVSVHSNDNLPGFRRPAGCRRPRPNQTLACHWRLVDGQLECRWNIESADGVPPDAFKPQPRASRALGAPVARLRPGHGTLRTAG
jgi:hypothetical protein